MSLTDVKFMEENKWVSELLHLLDVGATDDEWNKAYMTAREFIYPYNTTDEQDAMFHALGAKREQQKLVRT